MPVEKPDYDEIRRFGQTFTVVVNEVIEQLSAESLGVYVHLLSKPQDWIIRPVEVKRRFGIGDHTWRKVAKELRDAGVLFDQIERDDQGKVTKRVLYIGSQPIETIPSKINAEASIPSIIHDVDEPRRGESTPLQSKDSLQSKDRYKGLDISQVPSDRKDLIREYIDHRTLIKKKLTQQALTRFVNKVARCEDAGIPPSESITTVIDRGWSDLKLEWIKNACGQEATRVNYF